MYDPYDLYDLYDLARVGGGWPHDLHVIAHASWGASVANPAQPLATAGEELDDLL